MGQDEVQGYGQKMLCLIGNKGAGLTDFFYIGKLIVTKFPAAENNVAIVLALVIDRFNLLQGMVYIFMEDTAEIVLGNHPVDSLQRNLGADDADCNHKILHFQNTLLSRRRPGYHTRAVKQPLSERPAGYAGKRQLNAYSLSVL